MHHRLLIVAACLTSATGCASGEDASTPSPQRSSHASLLEAAGDGDSDRIAALVEQGVDIDVTDGDGRTPVMVATYADETDAVRALLDAGADVDIRDDLGNNPFLYAGAEGQLEILRLAAGAGADPRLLNRFGGTALIPAAEHGHLDVIRFLLEQTEVEVDHVNDLGWTATLEAVILGENEARQARVVALLLEHGADPAIADRDGTSPIEHAHRRGFDRIARLLETASRARARDTSRPGPLVPMGP